MSKLKNKIPSKTSPSKKASKAMIGYPIMEKLIESENFKKINETMSHTYDTLERMLKSKTGGLKKQKSVRAALKAYDLTIDLIRQLLKTKYDLVEKVSKNQPQTKSPQKK